MSQENARPWVRPKPGHLFLAPWHADCIANLQSHCREHWTAVVSCLWIVATVSLKEYLTPPWSVQTIPLSHIENRLEFGISVGTPHRENTFFNVYWLESFFYSFIRLCISYMLNLPPQLFFYVLRVRELGSKTIYIYQFTLWFCHEVWDWSRT